MFNLHTRHSDTNNILLIFDTDKCDPNLVTLARLAVTVLLLRAGNIKVSWGEASQTGMNIHFLILATRRTCHIR